IRPKPIVAGQPFRLRRSRDVFGGFSRDNGLPAGRGFLLRSGRAHLGNRALEKLRRPTNLTNEKDAIVGAHAPTESVVASIEDAIGYLINPNHGIPFWSRLNPHSGRPYRPGIRRELRVDGKGLRVAVDPVVHVEPVNRGGSEVIARGESPDLDRDLVLPKLLIQIERIEHHR